jgi:SAM-dependent methyltransferase
MFDPDAYKAEQTATWNAGARVWDSWHDDIERWFAPLTDRLLELAALRAGQRILDVGTGYGEPATTAARRVGPTAEVIGIDLSPAMIDVARRRAAGIPNVRFAWGDVDALDVGAGFDVVLSRLGLMFAVDRVAALASIGRALVPGGVLAFAVWGDPTRHLLSQALAPLISTLDLPPPPPGAPGPFSMSDPMRVTAEVTQAGFADVSVAEVDVSARFDSIASYIAFTREALPPPVLDAIVRRYGAREAPGAWRDVEQGLAPKLAADGSLPLTSVALCVRAVRGRPSRPQSGSGRTPRSEEVA